MARILLLIDSLGAGGAQRQIVGLAILLQEKGYQVKIIYYHPDFFYRVCLDEHDVENEYIGGAESNMKRFFQISQAIWIYHPEVVISFLDKPNMIACLLKAIGMKFQLITGERNTNQSLNRNEKFKFMLLKKADVIVPNSYSQEKFIKNNFPDLCHKVHTIINFVDLETFRPALNKKRGHDIIVAASAWESKNTIGLIEAAKIVKEHGYSFTIRWYGIYEETPYVKECQQRIMKYGLKDFFYLLPKTSSIDKEYQEADYFCLPSFYEGTPNALCEALACGLPIICSNVCDNGEYIKEGVNGFLFDPHDFSEMADKIEKSFLLPDEQYYHFNKISREVAETCFSKDRFIREYSFLINNEQAIC